MFANNIVILLIEIDVVTMFSCLISVMGTLHQGNQQPSTVMPNLNAVVKIPMTLNALVAQNQQLSRKHNKSPQNSFGRSYVNVT